MEKKDIVYGSQIMIYQVKSGQFINGEVYRTYTDKNSEKL